MLHIKKIHPMFTSIVTTADRFNKDFTEGGLVVAQKGDLKLWQRVIAVGSSVRDIKVGDMVMLNMAHYIVRKFDKNSVQNDLDNNPKVRYDLNWLTMDDDNGKPKDCLLFNDRDVLYSFEGEEENEVIALPDPKVIV